MVGGAVLLVGAGSVVVVMVVGPGSGAVVGAVVVGRAVSVGSADDGVIQVAAATVAATAAPSATPASVLPCSRARLLPTELAIRSGGFPPDLI
ncbi:MAG TPA: hypothetical protein VGO60_12455, partial [Iamia sp.]|nr:hypothetical protein [Iamia sp.]